LTPKGGASTKVAAPSPATAQYHAIAIIANKSIRTLRELIEFRHIDALHADVINFHAAQVWKRLMTRDNFFEAAEINFVELVDRLILYQFPQPNLFPALIMSGRKDHKDFFNKIISIIKTEEQCLLFIAARYGHAKTVRRLLESQSVNSTLNDDGHNTPTLHSLQMKAVYDSEMPYEKFIGDPTIGEYGDIQSMDEFDVTTRDYWDGALQFLYNINMMEDIELGMTILHVACRSGDIETIIEVLKHNPTRVNASRNSNNVSDYEFAANSGNRAAVRLLYDGSITPIDIGEIENPNSTDFAMIYHFKSVLNPINFIEFIFAFKNKAFYDFAYSVYAANHDTIPSYLTTNVRETIDYFEGTPNPLNPIIDLGIKLGYKNIELAFDVNRDLHEDIYQRFVATQKQQK
jgi:ankyrin repeat protein